MKWTFYGAANVCTTLTRNSGHTDWWMNPVSFIIQSRFTCKKYTTPALHFVSVLHVNFFTPRGDLYLIPNPSPPLWLIFWGRWVIGPQTSLRSWVTRNLARHRCWLAMIPSYLLMDRWSPVQWSRAKELVRWVSSLWVSDSFGTKCGRFGRGAETSPQFQALFTAAAVRSRRYGDSVFIFCFLFVCYRACKLPMVISKIAECKL